MPDLSGNIYSEIDASNNQAAPNGMPEGMPPSGVDDAWRAGMGAIKRSYDRDHAGAWCTIGGTANAIALTYAAAPAAYVQGEKYAFKAIATNTGATTLNINGLGAMNLFKRTPHGPSAMAGGEIQSGDIVEVEFDGSEFIMLGLPSNIGNFAGGTLTQTTAMSGAAFNEAFATIASAATLAIGAAPANYLQVTGTTTITAFDAVQAGACRILEFAASLTLANNANIVLPGGANITTQAGDIAKFVSAGGGVWLCAFYTRSAGPPLSGPASAATTLGGTDTSQALTSGGFAGNKSIANNGFYKFPGGMILQWGLVSIPPSGTATVTFPTNFPNAALSILATYNTNAPPTNSATATPINGSSMTVANGSSSAQTIYWQAIGN